MNAAQLKSYRDKLKAAEKNIAIRLYCDNGIIIDEGAMFVKWDDANDIVMAIKANDNHVNQPGVRIKTIITDYDMVQYMIAYSTKRSIVPIATTLGYSTDQIKNIIDMYDNPNPGAYINTAPKAVLDVIAQEDADKKAEAEANLQAQLDWAERNNFATGPVIRKRLQNK